VTTVAENLAAIRQQIRALEKQYDRTPGSVKLLAVSKRHSSAAIREAAAAGARDFGENYLQEAQEKMAELKDLDLCWHFIGPIQSNKTRGIAEAFDWAHSVDRLKIARRLSGQRPDPTDPLNICLQVNLSAEDSKSGVTLAAVPDLAAEIANLPGLTLRGLMAIPAPVQTLTEQRQQFAPLATCFRTLKAQYPRVDTLSMGMSNDFEAAIAEGSTLLRLGTALFGPRN
jgi:pyridoxal phosphate enzyme (YggS family)